MNQFRKLSHSVWQCKYHVVWCPKYRFRILRDKIGESLRDIIRQLCGWRRIDILEGNGQIDHIHLILSIPPKYSVSEAIGFLKGKSAIKDILSSSGVEAALLGPTSLGKGLSC